MSPYAQLFRARFLALLQYRVAALAGLATQVFWGFVRVMILTAFWRAGAGSSPMSLPDLVGYVWLGQATLLLVLWRQDPEVEDMVRTGNVAYELLRPVDLYGLWLARAVASRAAPTLLRCVPMLALALLFFGLPPPASAAAGAAWAASTLLALLLSGAFGALLTVSLLWTLSGRGLAILLNAGAWALGGIILPLPLYPSWMQPVVAFLPFRGLMDTPFRLWLGLLPAEEAWGPLAHQAAWAAALLLAGRALLARGARRLVVQGG